MLLPTTAQTGRPKLRWAVIGLAAAVFAGSLAVMAVFAGWSQVTGALRVPRSWWLAVAVGAELAAFAGYVLAYRSVAGQDLSLRRATEYVAIGFGAFLARGGSELDKQVLPQEEGDEEEGETLVVALDVLEHAPLAPAAWAASLALLAEGSRTPGLDFTLDWAILVPVGAVLAVYGVRHRERFADSSGWRRWLYRLLAAIQVLFDLLRDWRREWPALLGAAVYWAGDVGCLWACLAPLHHAPTLPAIVIAHAVGYVLTRRTFPLAGAGFVEVLMPLTLTAAGVPLATAIVGVFVYRLINLWLPLVPALIALHTLQRGRIGRSAQ
jgi:uncharacterized membrane protein YbhN (UPF0104 family)